MSPEPAGWKACATRSADILVCGFGRLSSRPSLTHFLLQPLSERRRLCHQTVHPQVVGSWERGLQAASAWGSQRIWRIQPKQGNERHRSAV